MRIARLCRPRALRNLGRSQLVAAARASTSSSATTARARPTSSRAIYVRRHAALVPHRRADRPHRASARPERARSAARVRQGRASSARLRGRPRAPATASVRLDGKAVAAAGALLRRLQRRRCSRPRICRCRAARPADRRRFLDRACSTCEPGYLAIAQRLRQGRCARATRCCATPGRATRRAARRPARGLRRAARARWRSTIVARPPRATSPSSRPRFVDGVRSDHAHRPGGRARAPDRTRARRRRRRPR